MVNKNLVVGILFGLLIVVGMVAAANVYVDYDFQGNDVTNITYFQASTVNVSNTMKVTNSTSTVLIYNNGTGLVIQ